MRLIVLVILLAVPSRPVAASPTASVVLSDQGGLHMLRVGGGGVFRGRWFARALIDPVGLLDGRHTLDLVTGVELGSFELYAGWRDTALKLADGVRLYDALVIGATARLAGGFRSISLHAGVNLAATVVAHGGGRPVEWILKDYGTRSLDPYALQLFVEARRGF